MKKLLEDAPRYAVHGANPALRLRIVELGETSGRSGYGLPAVLTDDAGGWFGAELVDDGAGFVAYAVNGYGDQVTARTYAERIEREARR